MLRQSALLLLLLAGCSQAQLLVPYGDRVEVASRTEGAAVASLESGGFVVAYEDVNASRVFACVYDIDGAQVVPEFQLNLDTDSAQGSMKVSSLANGGFVAVWRRNASTEVVARTFTDQGIGTSGVFVVTRAVQETSGFQVAGLANGNITIAWTEEGVGVLVNVYAPSGDAMYATPVVVVPWESGSTGRTATTTAVKVTGLAALSTAKFALAVSRVSFYPRGLPVWEDDGTLGVPTSVMDENLALYTERARRGRYVFANISFIPSSRPAERLLERFISVSSNQNGYIMSGPTVPTAVYSNFEDTPACVLPSEVSGPQDQVLMFPSGAVLNTGFGTFRDGFGLNNTRTLRGWISVCDGNRSDHYNIGNETLLRHRDPLGQPCGCCGRHELPRRCPRVLPDLRRAWPDGGHRSPRHRRAPDARQHHGADHGLAR